MTSSFPLSMSSDMVRPGAGRGVQLVSVGCLYEKDLKKECGDEFDGSD